MNIEPGWIAAAAAAVTALVSVGTQWMRYENLMATCKAEGMAALQTAAEALKEVRELAARHDESMHDGLQERDRVRREVGENLSAIRTHMHTFETWSRDEFMRKESFKEYLGRTERAQEQLIERIEKRLERIEEKIDAR